jgi:hypothetical protein
MKENKVPINRIGRFFGSEDYNLEIEMGSEWLSGDMNFTLVVYRVDKTKTKTDDVYGEALTDGIKFKPPVEVNAYVQILAPENKNLGTSKINQMEPGNLRFSVYQKQLEDLSIEINYGDYIGYYESETKVRYYVVNNDGRVNSDNKHTYGGYRPFYKTYVASPVSNDEFRGL